MAVLNDNQAKRKIKREKEKLDAVKKKADIIEKKEVFGSSWKDSLSEERKQELATILGTADCPAVVNVVDVHDFFEPINLFRDKEGNINELDIRAIWTQKKPTEQFLKNVIELSMKKAKRIRRKKC